MSHIWSVSTITIKEAIRHRIFLGISFASLLLIIVSVVISGLFMRDVLKILLDICLSAVNIGGLLIPFFVAINLLSSDIESHSIYTILSRQISRGQYLLGRYLGFAILTGLIMTSLTIASLAAVYISTQIFPANYFLQLNWSVIILSPMVSYFGIIMLTACVMFWSSVTTSSFLTTLLALSTYFVGQTVEDLTRFMNSRGEDIYIPPLVEVIVKTLLYLFPNLSAFDLKQQAANGLAIPLSEVIMPILYSACYSAAVLLLAIYFFIRKELQ